MYVGCIPKHAYQLTVSQKKKQVVMCTKNGDVVIAGDWCSPPIRIQSNRNFEFMYLGLAPQNGQCMAPCGTRGIVVTCPLWTRVYGNEDVWQQVEPHIPTTKLCSHHGTPFIYGCTMPHMHMQGGMYRFDENNLVIEPCMNFVGKVTADINHELVVFAIHRQKFLYIARHDRIYNKPTCIPLAAHVVDVMVLASDDFVIVTRNSDNALFACVLRYKQQTMEGPIKIGHTTSVTRCFVLGDALVTNKIILCTKTMNIRHNTHMQHCLAGTCNTERCAMIFDDNTLKVVW